MGHLIRGLIGSTQHSLPPSYVPSGIPGSMLSGAFIAGPLGRSHRDAGAGPSGHRPQPRCRRTQHRGDGHPPQRHLDRLEPDLGLEAGNKVPGVPVCYFDGAVSRRQDV